MDMGKIKKVVIVIGLIALVVGYYFYLSNKETKTNDTIVTAVQTVIQKNIEKDYPPTPKEVIKYYSDVTKCLYNEKYTDEQLEQMADKLLLLFDEELLEINPREQYIVSLKKDIKEFLNSGYSIVNYTPSNSADVVYDTVNGRECAKLYCTYSVKKGADYTASKHVFELRKDKDGHWKILGFGMADMEEE
ncbi:MAG: DUF6715 family protein [Lachnospiraceae bacterium]|nr:DUF6715 family protein [Lachnospiraceae bacterium]